MTGRICTFLLFALILPASDFTGKWGGNFDAVLPDGRMHRAFIFMDFKQTGSEVTGTAGEDEDKNWRIIDGKAEGDKLTFLAKPEDVQQVHFELVLFGNRLKGEAKVDRNGTVVTIKIDASKDGPIFWYLHGLALSRASVSDSAKAKDAESAFKTAIGKDATFSPPYAELGKLYVDNDRPAEAVPVLEKAIQLAPGYRSAYSHLAIAYRKTGQAERAGQVLEQLRKVIEDSRKQQDAKTDKAPSK
jgi:tetratricopeptide (TPR) repeat protein